MSSLLFLIAVIKGCPAPKIVDWSQRSWKAQDNETYTKAIARCRELYPEDAPCLKKFIKKEEGTYYAICGGRTNQVSSTHRSSEPWFFIRATQVPIKPSVAPKKPSPCSPGQ